MRDRVGYFIKEHIAVLSVSALNQRAIKYMKLSW